MQPFTATRFLLLAAAACFFLALILSLGATFLQSTWENWTAGGLLAWVLATLVP